jgi:DNA polymerase III alpha subunit
MQAQRIRIIKRIGLRKTLDFEVDHPDHNFYAEGILVSNSHAYSYAYLTAITTYLKIKYPKHFFLALLRMSREESDSMGCIRSIIQETKQLGISVLPPDITKSEADFSFEDQAIRFGLSHIKGVSDITVEKLLSFRKQYGNKFEIFEAAQVAGLPINVIVGLIRSGCIDSKGISRSALALEAQIYNLLTDREKPLVHRLAKNLNEDLRLIIKTLGTQLNEKGKPHLKESRLQTIRTKADPFWRMYKDNIKNEALCSYVMERHYLGFSYSTNLRDIYEEKCPGLLEIRQVITEAKDTPVKFVGFLDEIESRINQKKTPYLKLDISDETGTIRVLIYGQDRIDSFEQFHGGKVDPGEIVIVRGKKGDGAITFADSVVCQYNPVKLKKSELDKEQT